MPNVAVKPYYNFIGGLNTEAGPLTYPPNTWQDGINVVPDIDGSLSKRYAVNYESGYSLSSTADTPTEADTLAYIQHEWNNVGGIGTRNFVVVQRADTIYFYNNSGATISTTEKAFTIPLATYKSGSSPNTTGYSPISVSNAGGKLIITSADTEPILVEYVSASDTISHSAITLKIRDLYGVSDSLAVDERPVSLSDLHKYNLYNQGWNQTNIDSYFATTAVYPSNAQSWTAGKDSSDNFSASLLDKQDFGTSPAPKGRYVIDLFNRDRATVSGIAGLVAETEVYRPTTCAFYAGRAWYAGIDSTTMSTWVLFSQVADTSTKYGRCYQDADPTSEVVSDLIDSDGGVIPIQDAGTILRLVPAYNSLLVFATNGVWQILGGTDIGFSATSYEVRKLSTVGSVSAFSIVEAESKVFYWAKDGVWVIQAGQTGGFEIVLASPQIKTLYLDIPVTGKTYSYGHYYIENKTIYWVYNGDTTQDGIVRRFKKDTILCFDLRIGCFYSHEISSLASHSPYAVSIGSTKNQSTTSTTFNVVTAAEDSVVFGADTVVATLSPSQYRASDLRFLTVVPVSASTSYKVVFSRFEDGLTAAAKFKDWYSNDTAGVGYDTYIVTGYDLGNNQGGPKIIQGLYLTAFMLKTETGVDGSGNAIGESSVLLTTRWDWTNSSVAGKWSDSQQIYRHNRLFLFSLPSSTYADGYSVVYTKSRIRGRGRAVQFKFEGEQSKDFVLYGWSVTFIGNSNV